MKTLPRIASALSIALLFASCSITAPVAVSGNPIGSKTGKATGTCVLGMCFGADASITKAAQNGGITKVSTVDMKRKNALGLVQTYTTIVTGE